MKLTVVLNSFNPSLYKYQKIPVLIYLYNDQAINQARRIKGDKEELGFTEEPFDLGADPDVGAETLPKQALDTFLTGYYIIEDITYTYDGDDNTTQQFVTLMRREWPTRTENLINPPGLEGEPDEVKAAAVTENSPPQPTPEPTPEPTPTPEPEDLEITVSFDNGGSTFMQDSAYFETTGTWARNKEFDGFEAFEAEMDGTSWSDLIVGDGTWRFQSETDFDPGTYDLNIWFRAEGKLFEGTESFTIEEAGRYTYKITTLGPNKTAHVFEDGVEIFVGNSSFSSTPAQLLNTAYLGLQGNYPELTKNGGPDWTEAT